MSTGRMIDIIIPVYRNASVTRRCIDSVLRNISEIAQYLPRVIVINDSVDDEAVNMMLAELTASNPEIVVLANAVNAGFVKSANRGLAMARDEGRDAILVNSDTESFGGTLAELADVGYSDPQIGFVCPRSNNASICSLPHLSSDSMPQTPDVSYVRWKSIASTLPRMHYTPTAIGFYLLIKHEVLARCGGFEETFGLGYQEENSLIMRGAKCGFRAAFANRSFAFHAGSASFNLLDIDVEALRRRNDEKLNALHPEFFPAIGQYLSSPHFRAEELLSELARHDSRAHRVLIDLTGLRNDQGRTYETARRIVEGLCRQYAHLFTLSVLSSKVTFDDLRLNELDGLARADFDSPGKHAIAVAVGLPSDTHAASRLEAAAPVVLFCLPDKAARTLTRPSGVPRADALRHHVAQHANGLFLTNGHVSRWRSDTRALLRVVRPDAEHVVTDTASAVSTTSINRLADLIRLLLLDERLFDRLRDRIAAGDRLRDEDGAGATTDAAADLESLLQREGRDFVVCAYLTIFRRAPEAEGLENHLAQLERGVSKTAILSAMQGSAEGRMAGGELEGLREMSAGDRSGRLPTVRSMITWLRWPSRTKG